MLLLIAISFFLSRIFPYFLSPVPLGYDPGVYLYIFKKYAQVGFFEYTKLPEWIVEGMPPGLPFLSKILSYFVSAEVYLVPLMVVFSGALFISFYLFNKELWGKKAALWSIFILSASAIQYKAYWYYYAKQISAISFMLFSFYFMLKKSRWAYPLALLVLFFHRPTAVIFLSTLLLQIIFQKRERKYFAGLLIFCILAGAVYYLPNFSITIAPLLAPIIRGFIPTIFGGSMGSASGTFYNLGPYLLLSLLYIPLFIYGFKNNAFKKDNYLATFPLIISSIIVFFRLFFYRRFEVYSDILLISFAGIGASELFKSTKNLKLRKVSTVSYITILIIFITTFINQTAKPEILEDEFNEIKRLTETENDSYILVTDEHYMPWAYGWSERKVIAPGWGEYDIYWTTEDWNTFWLSDDREKEKELLLKLPKPLYIYSGDRVHQMKYSLEGDCFERINFRTYKFICN